MHAHKFSKSAQEKITKAGGKFEIQSGGVLTRIHAAESAQAEAAAARLELAFEISAQPTEVRPLIAKII